MTTQTQKLIKDSQLFFQSLQKESPPWLRDVREKSLSHITEAGFPSIKDEEWKYTNITPILEHTYSIAEEGKIKENKEFLRFTQGDTHTIVFVNGIHDPKLSTNKPLPSGVEIKTIQKAVKNNGVHLEPLFTQHVSQSPDSFAALNLAFVRDGVVIEIKDKVVCKDLIHIVHIHTPTAEKAIVFPRTIIHTGKSAEATVCESHIAFDDDINYFANALTDIFLSENAILHYTNLQKDSLKSYHINNTRVWQEQNSHFDGFTLTTGGQITRNNLDISLNGEGCDSKLFGLYCTAGTQLVDNHTSVDHRFPNCTSNQFYKGILNGASRGVFNGKIFVRQIAQKTNSYQLNKNLVLGKDARIDTKPQLEIFADDVRCTHGATIGQLNEDELFYLRSRAIPLKLATKMLAQGFVDEILANIQSEEVARKAHIVLEPTFHSL